MSIEINYAPIINSKPQAFANIEGKNSWMVHIDFEDNPLFPGYNNYGCLLILYDALGKQQIGQEIGLYPEERNFNFKELFNEVEPFPFKVGQFFKFQLAYYYIDDPEEGEEREPEMVVGPFTNLIPIKYIGNIDIDSEHSGYDLSTGFIDWAITCSDETEKLKTYQYKVFDENDKIIEQSQIERVTDFYNHIKFYINSVIPSNKAYSLALEVITSNNYKYNEIITMTAPAELNDKVLDYLTISVEPDEYNGANKITVTQDEAYYPEYPPFNSVSGLFYILKSEDKLKWNRIAEFHIGSNFKSVTEPPYVERVTLNENTDWKKLTTNPFTILDNDIAANVPYYYALIQKQNKDQGLYSKKKITNPIINNFEAVFLSDNEYQLCVRFNPEVTSFKDIIQEQKTDTIGGKYPIFFRNSELKYKELSISGLLSYWLDNDNLFISEDFISFKPSNRNKTNNRILVEDNNTNLSPENFRNELEFKLKALEWLNNGKPKLLRSPAEGNYIVRLMSVSLSPQKTLGRMLHTFSATAYEIADYNFRSVIENKVKYLSDVSIKALKEEELSYFDSTRYDIPDQYMNFDRIEILNSNVNNTITLNYGESESKALIVDKKAESYVFDMSNYFTPGSITLSNFLGTETVNIYYEHNFFNSEFEDQNNPYQIETVTETYSIGSTALNNILSGIGAQKIHYINIPRQNNLSITVTFGGNVYTFGETSDLPAVIYLDEDIPLTDAILDITGTGTVQICYDKEVPINASL